LDLADEAELARTETQTEEGGDNSQGNFAPETAEEPRRDWNEETCGDSFAREKNPGEPDAGRETRTESLREEFRDRFIRTARLAAGNQPLPNPSPAQFSGNFAPTHRQSPASAANS
jgi:hypothetical protein